jgi:Zn ribbon nucleic-acid-binding protein
MTTTYDLDPCPACGEADNLRWIDSTPTTDTWACGECGFTWVIQVELPAQTHTELRERAETHGE